MVVDDFQDVHLVGTGDRLGQFIVVDQNQLQRRRPEQVRLGANPANPPIVIDDQDSGSGTAQQNLAYGIESVVRVRMRDIGIGQVPHRG